MPRSLVFPLSLAAFLLALLGRLPGLSAGDIAQFAAARHQKLAVLLDDKAQVSACPQTVGVSQVRQPVLVETHESAGITFLNEENCAAIRKSHDVVAEFNREFAEDGLQDLRRITAGRRVARHAEKVVTPVFGRVQTPLGPFPIVPIHGTKQHEAPLGEGTRKGCWERRLGPIRLTHPLSSNVKARSSDVCGFFTKHGVAISPFVSKAAKRRGSGLKGFGITSLRSLVDPHHGAKFLSNEPSGSNSFNSWRTKPPPQS